MLRRQPVAGARQGTAAHAKSTPAPAQQQQKYHLPRSAAPTQRHAVCPYCGVRRAACGVRRARCGRPLARLSARACVRACVHAACSVAGAASRRRCSIVQACGDVRGSRVRAGAPHAERAAACARAQALSRMGALVEEIASLKAKGKQVMLISSGAVGLGRERMGLSKEVVGNVNNVVERQVGARRAPDDALGRGSAAPAHVCGCVVAGVRGGGAGAAHEHLQHDVLPHEPQVCAGAATPERARERGRVCVRAGSCVSARACMCVCVRACVCKFIGIYTRTLMQVLITQGDFSNRDRYNYLSQTLQRLTSLGVVPVINGMWCVV